MDDAVAVFKQNVSDFPASSNAYDSLAEAFEAKGERMSAIRNYKRSLELNPKNNHGLEHLKKLQSAGVAETRSSPKGKGLPR